MPSFHPGGLEHCRIAMKDFERVTKALQDEWSVNLLDYPHSLDFRKRGGEGDDVSVHWLGFEEHERTWEPIDSIRKAGPSY